MMRNCAFYLRAYQQFPGRGQNSHAVTNTPIGKCHSTLTNGDA